MFCHCALFTNNPIIEKELATSSRKFSNLNYVAGTSLDVLFKVRNLVHEGAKLLTHPLYGNLRPYQQPYRTVLLENCRGECDFESLSLLESAIDVYQSCADRLIKPEQLTDSLRDDYAFVDFELMRESFVKYRLL